MTLLVINTTKSDGAHRGEVIQILLITLFVVRRHYAFINENAQATHSPCLRGVGAIIIIIITIPCY